MIIDGGEGVRLRTVEAPEYERLASPWYRDPEVLRYSESGAEPYDAPTIRRMFESLSGRGEVYVVEIADGGGWRAVGDAALLPDALPIAIGEPAQRSRGVGARALRLLVRRARELGQATLRVRGVLLENVRALRMYEAAGFVRDAAPRVEVDGEESIGLTLELR